jgi:hypothetical protein
MANNKSSAKDSHLAAQPFLQLQHQQPRRGNASDYMTPFPSVFAMNLDQPRTYLLILNLSESSARLHH